MLFSINDESIKPNGEVFPSKMTMVFSVSTKYMGNPCSFQFLVRTIFSFSLSLFLRIYINVTLQNYQSGIHDEKNTLTGEKSQVISYN